MKNDYSFLSLGINLTIEMNAGGIFASAMLIDNIIVKKVK